MGQDREVRQGEDAGNVTAFEQLQRRDTRNESRIFWSEIAVAAVVVLLVVAYFMII